MRLDQQRSVRFKEGSFVEPYAKLLKLFVTTHRFARLLATAIQFATVNIHEYLSIIPPET